MQHVSLLGGFGANTGAWTIDPKTGQIVYLDAAPPAPPPTGPIIDQSKFNPSSTGPKPSSAPPPDAAIGECTTDQRFIFDAYGWRLRGSDEVCTSISSRPATVSTSRADCNPATSPNCYPIGAANGVVVTPGPVMLVGPFVVPIIKSGEGYAWALDSYKKLTREQAATIKKQLMVKVDGSDFWRTMSPDRWSAMLAGSPEPGATSDRWTMQSGVKQTEIISQWPTTTPQTTWLTNVGWMKMFGFNGSEPGWDDAYLWAWSDHREPWPPIAKFKHPSDGKPYGLFISIQPVGGPISALSSKIGKTADAMTDMIPAEQTRSIVLRFDIKPIHNKGLLSSLWDWIMSGVQELVADFYKGVWWGANALSSALCTMTVIPGGLTSAAAAGGPEAAAAAAATELLLSGKCPVPVGNDDTKGPPDTKKPFPWGPVIAGGIAVTGLLAFLLAPPKKRTA